MNDVFTDIDLDSVIRQNRHLILDGIFGTQSHIQVESSIAFAKYISFVGVNRTNYMLFLRILESNNKWIVDSLLEDRDPRLLFTVIKPNSYLITRAIQLLTAWHPGQIYPKVLLAILGIIEYSYYKADDGFRIYPIEIGDLNNIGKFIIQEEDQDYPINESILQILDRISQLGEYRKNIDKSIIAKHAFNIRIAYFDNRKTLLSVIPTVLMVKLKREDTETKPSKKYLDYNNKNIKSTKEKKK